MTTTNQPPRPDWSQIKLPPELSDDLQRLYAIETNWHIARATGMAFLGYIQSGEPSDEELGLLSLAWYELILCRKA